MKTQNQKGFTLVEIAIVLVIIGLLLGGVLKGQELIKSAKIKTTANQVKQFQSAIYTFQDKYRALPGASKNSALTTLATTEGTFQTTKAFPQLIEAGLISGTPDSTGKLSNEFGGTIQINNTAPFDGTLNVCYTNLDKEQAEFLDLTIDGDANPATMSINGDVKIADGTTAPYSGTAANTVCVRLQ